MFSSVMKSTLVHDMMNVTSFWTLHLLISLPSLTFTIFLYLSRDQKFYTVQISRFPVVVRRQKLTLYNSSATSPLTKAVVVAMAGIIFPAINLLYKERKQEININVSNKTWDTENATDSKLSILSSLDEQSRYLEPSRRSSAQLFKLSKS